MVKFRKNMFREVSKKNIGWLKTTKRQKGENVERWEPRKRGEHCAMEIKERQRDINQARDQ